VQTRADEGYQDKLVAPLSLFLRLHTLLHPARPSDHEHLTFGHLVLPSALQDEVQATDVLRVGRMYEDLIGGGETAKAVLAELVRGSTGEDEESEWGFDPIIGLELQLYWRRRRATCPPYVGCSADIGQTITSTAFSSS
jgi:hypothetical protein